MASIYFFFFFNDTATTEIYTLSLHDALPISQPHVLLGACHQRGVDHGGREQSDRKSTRLNSSHLVISYAVFCLKKKKKTQGRLSSRLKHKPPYTPSFSRSLEC